MSKTRNATIANLTFVIGQLEEIKSNINDTLRYIKNNQEEWLTSDEDLKQESEKDGPGTKE